MKYLTKLVQFKQWILSIVIGRYYTEKEVKQILSKMQYEMAQRIIGNRPNSKPIVPIEFWIENGKYDTNLYKLKINK